LSRFAAITEERIDHAIPEPAPRLSIVIPAYNEERRLPVTLESLISYLTAQSYTWEILVVSNGSTDGTGDVVHAVGALTPRVRLIEIGERGKGLAVKKGALQSTGEVVFLCDADMSMPPPYLARFMEAISRVDVVIGSREAAGAHRVGEPWQRHFMGRLFNTIVRAVAVKGIDDTQCGFKALRRDAADELFGRQVLVGFGFDVELLYLAQKYGYSIEELGIEWHFDADTRVRPGVDTMHMLGELLMIRLRDVLGHYRRASQPANRESRA
jgi:dolichyl-phosphate beta-glucosyltransferase